jgi:hypothetical protein
MFGMLDYRAHKLFLLVFGIPLFLLGWILNIGIPFVAVILAQQISEDWFAIFFLSLIFFVLIQLPLGLASVFINKAIQFVFTFFIDVIPCDGRNKTEADAVVWGGQSAILNIQLANTSPAEWTDELIEKVPKGLAALFFREVIIRRLNFIRDHSLENPDFIANDFNIRKLLRDRALSMPIYEMIICHPSYRISSLSLLFLIFLGTLQPRF